LLYESNNGKLYFLLTKTFSDEHFRSQTQLKDSQRDLERLFSKFGEVTSSKVIVDKQTGFSKRYGFVEMPDEQAAYEAIEKLNNTELDGSQIVVKMSVPTHRKKTRRRRNEPGNAK